MLYATECVTRQKEPQWRLHCGDRTVQAKTSRSLASAITAWAFRKSHSRRSFAPSTAPKMRATARVAAEPDWVWLSLSEQCGCTGAQLKQLMLPAAGSRLR